MDSRLRGKDENRRVPSNRPSPQRQKQVRIKKAAMLHGIVFPGSPGSRCIRPDRNLKHPATIDQPDDRGSMLGLRHTPRECGRDAPRVATPVAHSQTRFQGGLPKWLRHLAAEGPLFPITYPCPYPHSQAGSEQEPCPPRPKRTSPKRIRALTVPRRVRPACSAPACHPAVRPVRE